MLLLILCEKQLYSLLICAFLNFQPLLKMREHFENSYTLSKCLLDIEIADLILRMAPRWPHCAHSSSGGSARD